MKPALIRRLHKNFEDYVHVQEGVEFWLARDLQSLLGYTEWRNFLKVIEKARESCKNANNPILNHFVDVNKSIPVPKGGKRDIEDILLTRYACYLIAQNGDSRKEEIAFAQSYFAVQTRKQEIIEDHIRLAERLKARKQLKDSKKRIIAEYLRAGRRRIGFCPYPEQRGYGPFRGSYYPDDEKTPGNCREPAACRFPSDRYNHGQEPRH
jgi:DNA-damage-inducible protein D